MSDNKLRVHTLSKELGVTSKAILEKCQSEGVEGVTNHMSTLSAGLAETIREWFSQGAHKTAVETAAPVDLDKVRSRRRRKKAEGADGEAEGATATEVLEGEPAAEPEEVASPAEPEIEPAAPAPTLVQPAAPAAEPPAVHTPAIVTEQPAVSEPIAPPAAPEPTLKPEVLQPAAKAPPAAAAKAPAPAAPSTPPPAAVKPAGPQNVPAPAQMKGPRVVGFAKPDPVMRPAPRPMRPAGGGFGPPPMESTEPGRRGAAGKGKLSEKEEELRKAKHRANVRRGAGTGNIDVVGERLKEWNDRDLLERQERLQAASGRGIHARRAKEKKAGPSPTVIAPRKTKAQVAEPIIVHQLCAATGIGLNQLWPKFKSEHNMMITRNTVLPTDVAQVVMLDFGVELEVLKPKTELDRLVEEFAARERTNLQPRPPVVTMLGHVDHGKTSLLDAIRRTSVAEGEAGGITQHIGAYRVEREGLAVTFLDTPGHEAFTAMRARGANLTDVVVLVVAADDGVMPQTVEAVNHAKAAGVNIVVALNKIDLPGVDTNKIYGQLAELELTPTEWGGNTDVIKTSAATGLGVEELIAHLATLSELLDLKADPTVPATGTVIEAQMNPGMGPVMRVLVREGTLKTGDVILCGPGFGRVRSMRDDRGRQVQAATPAMPVEVSGLDEVSNAGDWFYQLDSQQRAKQIAAETQQLRRQDSLTKLSKPKTLEDLFQQRESGQLPELNLIVRADMQGSVDALLKTLGDIPDDQVKLNVLHAGIGSISESDVVLAEASEALIVGFNVAADGGASKRADVAGVDIRTYRIIYDLVDDIRKALEGLLPREQSEESRGKAEVREVFHVSRVGSVAGCYVTDGIIARTHKLRVIRNGQIIVPTADDAKRGRHRAVSSLRRFKDDVREVRAGVECGIRVEDFDDLKPGDVLDAYEVIETARKL